MLWTYRSAVGHTASREAGQSSLSLNFGMQWNAKLFARACISGLTHLYAYEWKSMERKVQCDRPFRTISEGSCDTE